MLQTVSYTNFSGGIADRYNSITKDKYYLADNLPLTETGKLDTRPGTSIVNRLPVTQTVQNVTGIYFFSSPLNSGFWVVGAHAYYYSSSTYTEILGPVSSNNALPSKTATGLEAITPWQRQLIAAYPGSTTGINPQRFYVKQSQTVPSVVNLGLPSVTDTPITLTPSNAGSNTYLYAFHYTYVLTDSLGTQFVEKGPVLNKTCSSADAPNANYIAIAAIPVLVNTALTNYDTANITIDVYRTVNNGTTYFLVHQITNGTTTYHDVMSDATLQDNEVIYTDGGLLEYNAPPTDSLFVTQVNDFFWYATANGVTHTIQGSPGSSPASYLQQTDQTVRGLSDIISFPILFCDKSIYRVEGNYDEFGNGGFVLREINSSAGCMSNRSIVKIPGGLVWAGNDGFYYTDGYQVIKISIYLPSRYQTWKNTGMMGCYDSAKNRVYWTVRNTDGNYNDTIAILYLDYGIKPDSVFGTISFDRNIYPTSIFYTGSQDVSATYQSRLLIGTNNGYFLYQDPFSYTDPKIDVNSVISAWGKKAIIYDFQSSNDDFGSITTRKESIQVTVEENNDTDCAFSIQHRRDDGGPWTASAEVRSDGAILWNISDVPWNSASSVTDPYEHYWNSQSILDGKRLVPASQLRAGRRQVRFTNAFTLCHNSDILGLATTTTSTLTYGLKYVTLITGIWPDNPEDYSIYFANDSYTNSWKIAQRISDTIITVFDPSANLPTLVSSKWQLSGYRKNERFNLLSYTVHFDMGGETQSPPTAPKGTNA